MFHVFAGSPFGRFQRGIDMQAVRGQLHGRLPAKLDMSDSRDSAALRWFAKSLATDVLHDEFIFLWIALEILGDASGEGVESTYTARYGHAIPECPQCGKTTSLMVRGATLRKFVESFGVGAEDASKLWKHRQMMHGAVRFEASAGQDLQSLVQLLRAVVAAALKGRLGLAPDEPPLVSTTGLSIHPSPSLGGMKPVSEDDLEPLIADLSCSV